MKKMKLFAIVFAFMAVISGLQAAEKWLPGPTKDWYIRLEDAKQAASQSNKHMYVLRTGSDWCGFCVRLNKDVFSSSAFKKFAKKNLILVYLDSPRRKPMPAEQKAYNSRIAAELNFGGGVPSAVILDSKGNIVDRIRGYAPCSKYMKMLKKAIRK